jgi:hypothetical protein
MQSDDKPINGQPINGQHNPSTFDLPDQVPPRPVIDLEKGPGKERFARLRAGWDASWEQDGFLHERWDEVRQAPVLGWHGMANWVKAALGLAGISLVILLLDGATDVLADAMHRLLSAVPRVQVGTDTSQGVFAVIDQPIRSYIAANSASLPISASTVYTVWQVVGLFGLIGGFFRSSGARISWAAWGACTIAMVYSAAPTDGRTIATGLAVLAWTAASALALRGLTLRPTSFTHIHNAGHHIAPQIHLPAPPAENTPDNVHPLQQR